MFCDMKPATRRVLEALDAVEGKAMRWEALTKSVGLTWRGMRTVMARMERDVLICNRDGCVEITFGGMRALKNARAD